MDTIMVVDWGLGMILSTTGRNLPFQQTVKMQIVKTRYSKILKISVFPLE